MEAMLNNNLIKDCPVTPSDYRRAVDIYGVDLESVRGKTARVRPGHVRMDVITPLPDSILDLYVSVTLCADIFYVNGDMCLGTVSRRITFVTATYMDSRKYKVLLPVLIKVIILYRYRGFKVEFILTDDEFSGMSVNLLEKGVLLNGSSANEHVPEIERMIRTIKERQRAKVNTLPYNISKYPKVMRIQAVLQSILRLNMFPKKNGVSDTLSPHCIFRDRSVDYKIHCRVTFGAYCQVNDEPRRLNSSVARATGAIALGPSGNLQGGYHFMSLKTSMKLSRRHWTELPMTTEVISTVETLEEKEKGEKESAPKDGVCFADRNGKVVEEIFEETPDPVIYSDEEEEGYV